MNSLCFKRQSWETFKITFFHQTVPLMSLETDFNFLRDIQKEKIALVLWYTMRRHFFFLIEPLILYFSNTPQAWVRFSTKRIWLKCYNRENHILSKLFGIVLIIVWCIQPCGMIFRSVSLHTVNHSALYCTPLNDLLLCIPHCGIKGEFLNKNYSTMYPTMGKIIPLFTHNTK